MEIYQKALLLALRINFIYKLQTVGLLVVFLIVIRRFVKNKLFPKWAFVVCLIGGMVILGLGSIQDYKLLHDFNNDAYITYYGKYKQWVEGYDEIYRPTLLMDGDEIRLKCHYKHAQGGEHTGYVVYGEKSKIVVYIGESLPQTK